MGIRGVVKLATLAFALLAASCGGGSGRQGTDVVVTGSGPSGQIVLGQSVTFQMNVVNAGDTAASNVTIRQQLTYPLIQDSITCAAAGGATCPAVLVSPMSVPSLPAGGSLAFQVTAHLATNGGTGTVQLNSTMSASFDGDVDTSNNSATVDVAAYFSSAAVSVTGQPPSGTVAGGASAQFVMLVSNAGPDAAINLTIKDFPETLAQATITCTSTGAAVCPTTLSTHGDPMTVAQLNKGDTLQFTVTGIAPTQPRGTNLSFGNKLAVTLDNDPDTSDNTADVLATAYTALAGVFATGTGPAAPVAAGSIVNFTMTVGNSGPDAAANVQIRNTVGSGATVTGITCQASAGATCPDLSVQPFQGAILPANATLTFNVGAQVKTGYNGSFQDTLAVSSTNDSSTTDNTAVAQGTAVSEDLQVSGSAPSGPIPSGSLATFTMTVTNAGPGTATNVAITDTVSSTLVLGTITCQSTGGATCPSPTGASMTASSMPSGSTLTFAVQTTVSAGASGSVSNTLAATALGESKPVDNSYTATVSAISADIGVSETAAQPTVNAGSSAVFTAIVANPGPNLADNVTVTQTLAPSGYAVSSVTCTLSSGASCGPTPSTSMTIPTLRVGDYAVLTYTVPVPSDKRDVISSTVQINAAGDPSTANNTATATTQAVNANSGQYSVFAADGRQYTLNIDFDQGTYTMSGNGNVWNATFSGSSGGDYLVGSSNGTAQPTTVRLRVTSDVIVGSHDFGTGVLPYVAARSFVTSLLQAQGAYDLATRNVTASAATTHAGTASIANNTLSVCQTDTPYVQRTSACGSALTSYALSVSGNVFTGVNTVNTSDAFNFVIARSGALTLMLSAQTATDGSQQLRIGLPDSSGIAGATALIGPSTLGTTGDWVTIALSSSAYSFSSVLGNSDSVASLTQISVGGPFAIRYGNRQSDGALIYVMQAVPLEVTVGDFSGAANGLLQITLP